MEWHRREEIIGKEVIDSTAKKIGFVRDLAYSADGRLALILENEKAEEVFLSFAEIQKIRDVVFIKSAASLEKIPAKTCPECKFRNAIEAKFCVRCGRTMK